jgi:hypothetical protein
MPATIAPEDAGSRLCATSARPAVTPDASPESAPPPEPPPAIAARRRATLAALFGFAAVGGPAQAQTGQGGGRGMRGLQSDALRPDKDAHGNDAPRDLLAAFARRLHDGVSDLALTPPQQGPWRDFVASAEEVGRHNERRLQRILYRSVGAFSAVAPLKTYIAAEVDEGEGRQEALADLKASHDKLVAVLDERQRDVLTRLFVATRSELQSPRER